MEINLAPFDVDWHEGVSHWDLLINVDDNCGWLGHLIRALVAIYAFMHGD